jgi:hypothetical protein
MDNQTSSPQLVFPSVPDDFCPAGNWTDVLQQFIDEVLSNGTINVPGLGDVTPAEIQNINTELNSLQSQVDAIPEFIAYNGTSTGFTAGGDSTVSVSFPESLPSTNYIISITPIIPAGGVSTATPTIGLLASSKAVGGFDISLQNNGSGVNAITDVEWGVIHFDT